MANVAFKKGLLANLPSTKTAGTFYVTTDERAIYLDVDASNRIRLGDFQEFATVAALEANTNPSTTALYYVTAINCLAKWNGTSYVQINLDTGATSIEVVGDGNAVTAASYSATTRKITLTKGSTFALQGADTDASSAITLYGVKKYAQEQAAADCKIGFYNLWQAMGGKGSIVKFVEQGMGAKDYIHINYKGGKAVAEAIYQSIVAGESNYTNYYKEKGSWK